MRGTHVIAIFVVLGLLVFGCTGPSEPQNGTGGQSGGGAGGSGTGTQDLSGLGYSALVALGVPIECDVTVPDTATGTVTAKMYISGETFRYEVSNPNAESCKDSVVIMKDDALYMGCKGEQMMPEMGCDWFKFETNESESTGMSSEEVTEDLDDLPENSFSCKPWVYDASKFTVTGKACTMDDLMAMYTTQ